MSTKIIELKDMEGNILLPYAYSASHDSSGNDFGTVYATKILVNTKADDNSVVHLTDDEVITGVKTISTVSSGTHLILKSNVIDTTVTPEEAIYDNYIDFRDKNNSLIGRVFTTRTTEPNNYIGIQAWNGSTNHVISVDSSGNTYCPTPSSASDNSNKIATTAWVNSHIDVNPNVVRTTGSQTITGAKTFNTGANDAVRFISTVNTQEIPEANRYYQPIGISDPSNTYYDGYFEIGHFTDGSHALQIVARQNIEGTNYHSVIGARIAQDGTTWGTCPSSDKDNSILTTIAKSKASNGYFKLGNGMLIQWGTLGAAGTDTTGTFNFPVAFSNTNYAICITSIAASASATGSVRANRMINYNSLTATSCGWQQDSYADAGARWIAIGY